MTMTVTIIVSIFILGFVTNLSAVQDRGWRGIVPLSSTRQEVERVIGPPLTSGGITYDLKTDRVNVSYASGTCEEGKSGWKVPPGTVTDIKVYPQRRVLLAELHIDLRGFRKFSNPHVRDSISYANEDEGISIGTNVNGEVFLLEYFPRKSDNYLRCTPSNRALSNKELKYYKFDEYSSLTARDERMRLDNFASRLLRTPKSEGYILVYAGRGMQSRQVLGWAKRAKAYLLRRWRIQSSRIETRFAGTRDKLSWELYLVPAGFDVDLSTSQ